MQSRPRRARETRRAGARLVGLASSHPRPRPRRRARSLAETRRYPYVNVRSTSPPRFRRHRRPSTFDLDPFSFYLRVSDRALAFPRAPFAHRSRDTRRASSVRRTSLEFLTTPNSLLGESHSTRRRNERRTLAVSRRASRGDDPSPARVPATVFGVAREKVIRLDP